MKRFHGFMFIAVWIFSLVASPVWGFDTSRNPDQWMSIGMDVSGGHLAGMMKDVAPDTPHTDGGFIKGLLDVRIPMTNTVTLHAFGSSTGINNNLQFSEGHELGVGLRVYLH